MNTQQIAERIMELTNEKKRREFIINTYREWELVGIVPELLIEYYRLVLPSGRQFIAMEFPINWQSGGRDVTYYDVPRGIPYSHCGITAWQAAAELMEEQRLLRGVKG